MPAIAPTAGIVADLADAHDWDTVRRGVRAMLRLAGRDPDEPGLVDTPDRVLRAWLEQTARPGDPAALLAVQFDATHYDEMILVGPIPLASVCEHHLLPFTGHAWVGYIPNGGGVVGLSKIARLVEHYARRPQLQERMTAQMAEELEDRLAPSGVGVVVRATHTCMTLRGVRKPGAEMTTSTMLGALRDDPSARAEFLRLAGL
jgi:GTP cyclohydrolase I